MSTNVDEFVKVLGDFAPKVAPELADQTHRTVALEALGRLIAKTPVDTGHARAGWQVTIDQPTEAQVDGADKSGRSALASGKASIEASPSFSNIIIQNNVEYIEVLEEGRFDGAPGGADDLFLSHRDSFYEGAFVESVPFMRRRGATGSIQAPEGMLGVTFQEILEGLESETTEAA